MRRVSLLMVLAVAAFMSLGTTGAMAAGKAGGKPAGCKQGKGDKCKPKPKPKPKHKDCGYGKDISGKCKPKPPECQYGTDKDGKCNPKPPECQYGKDDDGNCKQPPIVLPPPKEGPCSQADLVLLEDLLKGTGALACVYLGDNAPNASGDKDCPDALLALPLDNLIGACVYLPPADVGPTETSSTTSSETSSATSSETSAALAEANADSGPVGLLGLLSQLTGLFGPGK
jgi:hypothetical protein